MSTPTLGAGLSSAGTSSAGTGEPATADAHVSRYLLTADGKRGSAPLLDWVTKDLLIDTYGNVLGADAVDQAVQFVLTTRRGSTMDPEVGLRPLPGLMVPNIGAIARAYVAEALSRMVAKGLIAILSTDVARVGASLSLTVSYRNLTSAEDRRVLIPIGA